jgi:hypothetical protein
MNGLCTESFCPQKSAQQNTALHPFVTYLLTIPGKKICFSHFLSSFRKEVSICFMLLLL